MNFAKNSSDIDLNINSKLSSSKISIGPDFFKNIPSNQITINFSNDSHSSQKKKNENLNSKEFISKNEKKEKKEEESEEEINSDEYVSSTMLDVDTNTYINLTNNIKNNEEKSFNNNTKNKFNNMHTKGKIKKKNEKNLNYFLLNNIQSLTDEKEQSTDNNNNNFNKNTNNNKNEKKMKNNNNINEKITKIHHQNNKSDFFINYRPDSINRDKKKDSKNSNSIDKKVIFTPNNESKKRLQILRDMIIKKLDHYQIKNPFFINQSNTINIIENNEDIKNENEDKIKSLNNDNINKKNINLELESSNKNNRNIKTSRITHNNSITIISNNNKLNKNNTEKINNPQNIQNNNNININIYNKNIIKDIGSLNIDEQKFHLIPQTSQNFKTQGRVGKITYNNQNKRNNFIYISNNNNTNNIINKEKINSSKNKKNKISPPQNSINCINNMEYYNSICINKNKKSDENNYLKHINIHSLKNLQSENLQKNIKKYLLEDEYLTIFPLSNDKNNILEKPKKKLIKGQKNKKIIKNKNNKNNGDIKYNQNNFKIKHIMPININGNNKQLRSVHSYYVKKENQPILNNYQSEQILNTITNNHNKKIDIYNNFKYNYNGMINNKNINNLNKRIIDEKMKKNRELSFNYVQENNSINNLLSLKKIKILKNKLVLQSPDYYFENINKDGNNNHFKKIKPIITRKKLDLMTEGNKTNLLKNNSKNLMPNNNHNIRNKSNNNSSVKRIIYIDNSNFKKLNSRPLIYNSLSPNCQSIKQIMNKDKMSNIKEIYNNINNNLGRNTFNIYASSRINPNVNNINMNNNNNGAGNNNDQIVIKKIHNIKNNNNKNVTKTINYNNENIYELPNYNLSAQHKKMIVFNNVSNYNINSSNNTLNNLTNIKEGQNNDLYKKTIEIFSPFSSINNKNNNNHKKFFVNKQINNNRITSKEKKNNLLEQNINYLDNNKIKNIFTFTGNNNSNKYLYNKNMMNKINKNENYNNSNHHHHPKITSTHYNYNIKTNHSVNNNNFFHFSNSNDKDRNTITNSYGNLYIIKTKNKKKEDKNITLDIPEKKQKNKNQKHMSPIQELKKRF